MKRHGLTQSGGDQAGPDAAGATWETRPAPLRQGPLALLRLFGDVRAGRAAARSDVNDSSTANASEGNPAGPDTAGATRETRWLQCGGASRRIVALFGDVRAGRRRPASSFLGSSGMNAVPKT